MSDTSSPTDSRLEKFVHDEYLSITQIFSSGLNAMAVLLTLFFVFTGAMLNYVGGLFTEIAKPDSHFVKLGGIDFRILQIYGIIAVGVVLTVWSASFVHVFRDVAGKLFRRASEVEALSPGATAGRTGGLFALLHDWYSSPRGSTALRWLYWSTVAFYVLMAAAYAGIVWSAVSVHRNPPTATPAATSSNSGDKTLVPTLNAEPRKLE